jgi:hypothetical protein
MDPAEDDRDVDEMSIPQFDGNDGGDSGSDTEIDDDAATKDKAESVMVVFTGEENGQSQKTSPRE